jgi:hypothetical protein
VPSTSPFPVKKAADDKGFDQMLGGDEKIFKVRRNGNNLMCPFQCDLCHCRSIQKWDYRATDAKDRLLLQCIRRASLDAFWARESSTVQANLQGAKKLEGIGDSLGMESVCPPMGPYSTEDMMGLGLAVCILIRTIDPGKTEELIQFSTARYLRSTYSSMYHASARHQGGYGRDGPEH